MVGSQQAFWYVVGPYLRRQFYLFAYGYKQSMDWSGGKGTGAGAWERKEEEEKTGERRPEEEEEKRPDKGRNYDLALAP